MPIYFYHGQFVVLSVWNYFQGPLQIFHFPGLFFFIIIHLLQSNSISDSATFLKDMNVELGGKQESTICC